MARSKRRTVKLALLTMVLAAATAGVYYFIVAGGAWSAGLLGGGELIAESAPAATDAEPVTPKLSDAEFNAVASAWAATTQTKPATNLEPEVAPAQSTEPVATSDNRYHLDALESSTTDNDRYSTREAMPVVLPAIPAHDVTRGQEPNQLATAEGYPARAPEELAEEQAASQSSRRAREAFGDALADSVPAAPRPASASDRYGAPLATNAGNPFESQTTSLPAATAAASEISADYSAEPIRSANAAYGAMPERRPRDETISNRGESPSTTDEGTGRPGERALEGPQKPALVIQKFAPPEIQVGKAAKFAIQVRNVSGHTAEQVVIRDEVPQGTRVVNTTPRATTDGNDLVWDIGALSTGEERTVEIELMPISEGEIGSVATVSCAAQASAKTRCTMPQLAIRMTAPNQVMIGQEQRVKIELRNPGTGDATGVMLLENVPDNVRHAAGPALEFEIGTLRAGETRELELVLTAERAGPVVNALTARADGDLQVQQQVEFEVIAPELQLTVDGPQRRYLERPATYQVIIENPGTAPAHDIELVTKLPKGMQFVKANNMGEYDAATHSVYWSLAQLPEGEKGSVELTAMPIEPGQQTLQIQGKAQQGLADEVKQEVLVEGLAAIMFEVLDAEDPIEVGGETSYVIRVVNQGSKAATNVQVVVSLPPGIAAISATGETRHTVQAGGVVFEPLAQLAPKTDTVFRVQAKGVQPGDQRVTVQVNTDDISQPIRREESTRVFGDE